MQRKRFGRVALSGPGAHRASIPPRLCSLKQAAAGTARAELYQAVGRRPGLVSVPEELP